MRPPIVRTSRCKQRSDISESAREQGRSGLGLAAQRSEIEAFTAGERLSIKCWYQDVQAGAGADALLLRPGLARALKKAKAAHCPLIVSNLADFATWGRPSSA